MASRMCTERDFSITKAICFAVMSNKNKSFNFVLEKKIP